MFPHSPHLQIEGWSYVVPRCETSTPTRLACLFSSISGSRASRSCAACRCFCTTGSQSLHGPPGHHYIRTINILHRLIAIFGKELCIRNRSEERRVGKECRSQ